MLCSTGKKLQKLNWVGGRTKTNFGFGWMTMAAACRRKKSASCFSRFMPCMNPTHGMDWDYPLFSAWWNYNQDNADTSRTKRAARIFILRCPARRLDRWQQGGIGNN